MSEAFALTFNKEDRYNSMESRVNIVQNEHIWCRFLLNECVNHIYKIKGLEVPMRVNANECSVLQLKRNVDQALLQIIPPKPPIVRVCRKLFREARNNRKSTKPQKCNWKKRSLNFVFKAKHRKISKKVRRGYLDVARENVMRRMRVEENGFQEIQVAFYEQANELLNDMRRLRYFIQASNAAF